MYRFFVQSQIDINTHNTIGYELLLRKYIDNQWIVPSSFTECSLEQQSRLILDLADLLKTNLKKQSLSWNIDGKQADNEFILGIVIFLKKQLNPTNLTIELTDSVALAKIKKYYMLFQQNGIKISIDDVGTGNNKFKQIVHELPFVDQIKFAIQNFRMAGEGGKVLNQLSFWKNVADQYKLGLVLEGVESKKDQEMADRLKIKVHQGFYYNKPYLVTDHSLGGVPQ